MMEKVLMGCYPSLQQIFSVAIFPHVMWGGEDKIEVIEEFISNVLHVGNNHYNRNEIESAHADKLKYVRSSRNILS